MDNVIYFSNANRQCAECRCTKAVSERIARRDPCLVLVPTTVCDRCGDRVEVDTPILNQVESVFVPSCDSCGCTESLARAEVTLLENMGQGYVYLCERCIAQYDRLESA